MSCHTLTVFPTSRPKTLPTTPFNAIFKGEPENKANFPISENATIGCSIYLVTLELVKETRTASSVLTSISLDGCSVADLLQCVLLQSPLSGWTEGYMGRR